MNETSQATLDALRALLAEHNAATQDPRDYCPVQPAFGHEWREYAIGTVECYWCGTTEEA